MPSWDNLPESEQLGVAEAWLTKFSTALVGKDYRGATALLKSDAYWRDLLTFNWNFKTLHGTEEVLAWLSTQFDRSPARNFRLDGRPYISVLGHLGQTLDFFFTFETDLAIGRGHVRLVPDEGHEDLPHAFTILTSIKDLKIHPETTSGNRPREWMEGNEQRGDHLSDSDPDVIIVGAGQAGLMLGARLRQLNVKTLIVERGARVGDTWRKRYRTLKLHNDITMNHFPYLPFPESWPTYLPKDKVADWLEFYAHAMDLDVWTGTSFENAVFDPKERAWSVTLRLVDGTTKIMRPRHVVSAMGVSGLPRVPQLPGADDFQGTIIHSSYPFDELDVAGKKAVVVGAGTSAHDIAEDFCARGAEVTMVQRSSVTVLSLEPSGQRVYQLYRENDGVRPIVDTDMIGAATPYPLIATLHGPLSRSIQEADSELLDGLRKAGFLLDNGEDDTGFYMKLLRYHAGYYLNIGASDLIVEGKIKVKSGVGVDRLTAAQVVLSDGTPLDADIVVMATGYQSLQEQIRKLFGSAVADKIGPVWGIGEDNELRNMYAPTAQDNFFVLGGGFPAARFYSKFTALYIKADLNGLVPHDKNTQGAEKAESSRPVSRLQHSASH